MTAAFRIVDLVFGQIGNIDGLFQSQQVRSGNQGHIVFGAVKGPGQLALVQVGQQLRKELRFLHKALVAALGRFLTLVNAALHHFDVGHDQLQIDDVNVPQGIGGDFHMGDVAVFETTDHMDNGIGGTDVAQKFVAQALTLGSTLHKAGDVHKLNHSGGDLLGLMKLCQPV